MPLAPPRFDRLTPRIGRLQLERAAVLEDPVLELLERRCRIEPELVDEHAPHFAVRRERLGLPAGAVQREHQLGGEPLSQRMVTNELLQLANKGGVPAEREVRLDPLLERREANLLQSLDRRVRERLVHQVGERRSAPKGECLAEEVRGPFRVLLSQRLRRVSGHTLEHRQVKLVGSKPNRVAGRARLDSRRRPEQLPQVGDLPLHLLQRRCGSSPGVELVCEAIDGDDAVRVQEQYRERRPLLRAAKLERAALADDLEWPQDPELEQSAGPYSFDTASAPGASTITAIQERSERCTS